MVTTVEGPVFATELGDTGPRICFLHGLFGQGKNWTGIGKAIADHAQVLLVDLPNHGRSAWTESFSYSGMAADIAGLLRREGGGESYVVVGHSMGGKVAMMLALEHPELVGRLCVVDVSPVDYSGLRQFGTYVEGMRALDLNTLPDRVTADRELAATIDDPVIRGFLLQNLHRRPKDGGPGWRWQMNLQLLGDHLLDIGAWPEPVTEPYRGPVLWVAGEESAYIQPEHVAAMRALFPHTQLVRIKGSGHWVHADRPEAFLSVIRQFLRVVSG